MKTFLKTTIVLIVIIVIILVLIPSLRCPDSYGTLSFAKRFDWEEWNGLSTEYGAYIDGTTNLKSRFQHLILPSPMKRGQFFRHGRQGPLILWGYKVLYCGNPKALQTQMRAFFCHAQTSRTKYDILTDPLKAHYDPKCLAVESRTRKNWKDPSVSLEDIYKSSDWLKFSVLREPIDRFISAYVDKCVNGGQFCYDCPLEDIHCFARETYFKIKRLSDKKEPIGTFKQFINHFYPMAWSCDFKYHKNDYQFFQYNKSNSFNDFFRGKLQSFGFSARIIYSGWGADHNQPFLGVNTGHASNASFSDQMFQSILEKWTTLDYLFKTYYIDYEEFGFALPPEILSKCNEAEESVRTNQKICDFAMSTRKL